MKTHPRKDARMQYGRSRDHSVHSNVIDPARRCLRETKRFYDELCKSRDPDIQLIVVIQLAELEATIFTGSNDDLCGGTQTGVCRFIFTSFDADITRL